ncbi:TonB-dependent receptor [Pelomonas sp. V22]|uniref:TonB-dependent receptor n=1 Tax=Pelomonas sp. V22 TaxID=2822139 RepID=UPI0024A844B1|nr:TonB-dependent receptor [Pelomonas sp. V22]MDI4632577.1 TonB-dependent receptor [Pelomonas sp. V22]
MSKSSGMSAGAVLRHSALALAVSLACAGGVMAQSAEGSLTGQSKAGATVIVVNLESGQQRTVSAGRDGQFYFSKLQPGKYRVTADGISREVQIIIGSGSSVSLLNAELERVDVVGNRQRSIDVNSVESSTVFTAEQLRSLPVARSIEAVAQLAPGVNKGDGGLGSGNLPVFSGASVAENGYYINGFDVTNIRNFLSYASLPFDAIAQQQIKSGGYGAEYGRSLGGVLSLVTKRGTNEWKGGASVYWNPDFLRATGTDVLDYNTDNASPLTKKLAYTRFTSANKTDQLSYNLYLGGPIIKDKLFVFGLIEGRDNKLDRYSSTSSYHETSNVPNGMIKLDFAPDERNQFELTAISAKSRSTRDTYLHNKLADAPAGTSVDVLNDSRWYMTSHLTNNYGPLDRGVTEGGSTVLIGKYTVFASDNLTLSLLGGKVDNKQDRTFYSQDIVPGCPRVYDPFPTIVGCWNPALAVTERDTKAPRFDTDERRAFRLDAEYVLGNHTLRAGYDAVKFTSSAAGSTYIGGTGQYWRYFDSGTGAKPNLVPKGQQYVREWFSASTSGTYEVRNTAAYLEDSWKVDKNWLLYGGLRNETFDNRTGDGTSFVKATKLLAPRFGASWDVNGDASLKVYGNAGRYYIPVASNTNIRISRAEAFAEAFYTFTGKDPKTGAPLGLKKDSETGTRELHAADPATLSDTKLKPMYQDEMILGLQKALNKDWTVGVKGVLRKVKNGMDDFCGGLPQKQWAQDNGYKKYVGKVEPTCIIINPGRDVSLKLDLENDGNLKQVTIPAKYFDMLAYKRNYKALEFSLDKRFDGQWSLGGSYVWSKQTGTAEGYVQSDLNQVDAGATQDFDFASFTHGSDGPGPNDRRHVLKAYGVYQLSDSWRVGGNVIASAGRPTSCNGFVPNTVADYAKTDQHQGSKDYGSASSYYCLGDDKKTHLTQRGTMGNTPWTYSANLNIAFMPALADGKLTFQLDVFNLFNAQRYTEVNQGKDFSRANTDLQYSAKPADQASVKFNPNYRQPTDFQAPRSARITARYEF